MTGRRVTEANAVPKKRSFALYAHLQSHASGKRRGDQFCVSVADRLVLPTLTNEHIQSIASGRHSMDEFVRDYVQEHLGYRFVMVPNGKTALYAERAVRTGAWGYGNPLLNPWEP